MRMMGRLVFLTVLALGLGGCGVTAVVGAAATVVGAGVKVAGSAVSATIDVVGSGVSGAIDLATSDDDDDDTEKAGKADDAARQVLVTVEPAPAAEQVAPAQDPAADEDPAMVDTVWDNAE